MRLPAALCLSTLVFSIACKTTTHSETASTSAPQFDLSCRAPLENGTELFLHTHTSPKGAPSDSSVQNIVLEWKVQSPNGTPIASEIQILENQSLSDRPSHTFQINSNAVELVMNDSPALNSSHGPGSCTQIVVKQAAIDKIPRCNAIGTSAQGWYVAGRLIKHTKSCATEVLSCGVSKQEGWYVQKKTERVFVAKERCGWQKELPVCRKNNGVTGWHSHDRLIARDDECLTKSIECNNNSSNEGWVTFKRSAPSLYAESNCLGASRSTARMEIKNQN